MFTEGGTTTAITTEMTETTTANTHTHDVSKNARQKWPMASDLSPGG